VSDNGAIDIIAMIEDEFGVERKVLERMGLELDIRKNGRIYARSIQCSSVLCDKLRKVGGYKQVFYFGKLEKDGFRPSMDACALLGPFATKNILEIGDEDVVRWLQGQDIEGDAVGYVIIRWRNFFVGCGKGNGKVIRNFVPKSRRI